MIYHRMEIQKSILKKPVLEEAKEKKKERRETIYPHSRIHAYITNDLTKVLNVH